MELHQCCQQVVIRGRPFTRSFGPRNQQTHELSSLSHPDVGIIFQRIRVIHGDQSRPSHQWPMTPSIYTKMRCEVSLNKNSYIVLSVICKLSIIPCRRNPWYWRSQHTQTSACTLMLKHQHGNQSGLTIHPYDMMRRIPASKCKNLHATIGPAVTNCPELLKDNPFQLQAILNKTSFNQDHHIKV